MHDDEVFKQLRAHAGNAGGVVWVAGDSHLISIGSKDHIVLQWKCIYESSKEQGDVDPKLLDSDDFASLGGHGYDDRKVERSSDSFGKVQHWRSSICPPSRVVEEVLRVPECYINLQHVHGVRLSDTHYSFCFNAYGHPVFIVGCLGVIQSMDFHRQFFYHGHRKPLASLTVTQNGLYAASGEVSEAPEIHIWDACNASAIAIFRGLHSKGITCISFVVILAGPSCP